MDFMIWVWLGVIVLAIILEAITFDITSIWFAFGAIPSLILSLIGGISWYVQLIVFIVLSVLLILSLRGVVKKWLFKNAKEKTNMDALLGKEYKLLSAINEDNSGTVKINGVVWSCLEVNSQSIDEGNYVKIIKIEGNKLIVEKVEK